VTFRIRRSDGPDGTLFALSGEMDADSAWRLEDLLEAERNGPVLLDLGEVTLVARNAVRFLARVEARGTRIVNCPEYVRSWIVAEDSIHGQ
jgi:anti-anti-sigma regulatory factor